MRSGLGDTIFAVASGGGRVAVTVMRLSGPRTGWLLDQIAGGRGPARRARLRTLRNQRGDILDRALVLWFPAPSSFTGEDSGELQLHGGRAVAQDVALALTEWGARPAEAGEFTRRAFGNGKIDLLAAEATADLIAAETSAQRIQALRQLEGELGTLYAGWTSRLTRLLAWQEALIDFPDEDLPADATQAASTELELLQTEIRQHLTDNRRGERLRDGLVFAIIGPPNVGKSTLLNALAEREAAIVAPTPGTTRDVLEIRVVLGDVPVTLLDTAGLRDASDPVETEGIRRAVARATDADLVIEVADSETGFGLIEGAFGDRRLRVASKGDLVGTTSDADITVSAMTGLGMTTLRERLTAEARALTRWDGPPALTRARHRAALLAARAHLQEAALAAYPEICAENLRAARHEIGRITGQVDVDAILDTVFRDFCIGK